MSVSAVRCLRSLRFSSCGWGLFAQQADAFREVDGNLGPFGGVEVAGGTEGP